MKSQEKFARLARQGASPAEGTAGAEVRRQEKYSTCEAQRSFLLTPEASLEGTMELTGHA